MHRIIESTVTLHKFQKLSFDAGSTTDQEGDTPVLSLIPSATGHHESLTVYYWKCTVRVQQSTVLICFESCDNDSKQT